jgi:hypothetical protein
MVSRRAFDEPQKMKSLQASTESEPNRCSATRQHGVGQTNGHGRMPPWPYSDNVSEGKTADTSHSDHLIGRAPSAIPRLDSMPFLRYVILRCVPKAGDVIPHRGRNDRHGLVYLPPYQISDTDLISAGFLLGIYRYGGGEADRQTRLLPSLLGNEATGGIVIAKHYPFPFQPFARRNKSPIRE